MNMLVEKIHKDAKEPVRAHPLDAGSDVFAYDFKRKYVAALAMPQHDIVTPDSMEPPEPIQIEVCIDDENDDENMLSGDSLVIYPMERALIGTGIKATVAAGYEIQVRPRSGLALKQGLTVVNTPGTIDSPYRGEIGVILINESNMPQEINKGDKIAQLIVNRVELTTIKVVESLDDTERGEGGFGSTGKQ